MANADGVSTYENAPRQKVKTHATKEMRLQLRCSMIKAKFMKMERENEISARLQHGFRRWTGMSRATRKPLAREYGFTMV